MNCDRFSITVFEKRNLQLLLWALFFVYSVVSAIVFQKVLLPMFPAIHGGGGLIGTDSTMYHNVAIRIAESIKQNGWVVWTVWPQPGITGNISVLGALYAVFGYNPMIVIPINAALHATSAIVLLRIGMLLWPGRIGLYSGLITCTLFVVFPSSLNWYAQINKDGYVIFGILCILYSWMKGIFLRERLRSVIWTLCGTFFGVMCVIFARPYNVKILIPAGIIVFMMVIGYLTVTSQIRIKYHLAISSFLVILMFIFTSPYMPKASLEDKELFTQEELEWKWKKSVGIPGRIDKIAETAATIRAYNILNGRNVGARSMIDEHRQPDSINAVISYMPRALQIALLAPFPSKWFERINLVRMVSVAETLIWYLSIPGIFISVLRRKDLSIYIIIILSLYFLCIYGFTLPNVGTLYRIRYVYIFLLMLIGSAGWISVLPGMKIDVKS